MNDEQKKLALEIMHCPMVELSREDNSRARHEIVISQSGDREFQLPEPWNGNINAPILFISSNPGYDRDEHTVTKSWDHQPALDHFENRLISKFKMSDGTEKDYPRFLRNLRGIATQLLELSGQEADPSKDFCSTEIVHCKSNDELGVACATLHCASRYLERVLRVSDAKVVVLIGGVTLSYFNRYHKLDLTYGDAKNHFVAGRDFIFASLYHPNARFEGVGAKRTEAMQRIQQTISKVLNPK